MEDAAWRAERKQDDRRARSQGARERREDESARRYKKDIKGRSLSSRIYVSLNSLVFSQSLALLN